MPVRFVLGAVIVASALQAGPAAARTHHRHSGHRVVGIPAAIDLTTVSALERQAEAPAEASSGTDLAPDMQAAIARQPSLGQSIEPGGLKALVARHAAENGVPFALADAVVRIESGYNPRAANRSGALGLMQIKAQTARAQGFSGSASALLNPDTNLRFAMRYLATAYRLSGGDVCGTVMRYQQGHGAQHMSSSDRSYCARARQLMARA
jgi:soluble lytic murein transglycosylase-like protein